MMPDDKTREELIKVAHLVYSKYSVILRMVEEQVIANLKKGWSVTKAVNSAMKNLSGDTLKDAVKDAIIAAILIGYGKKLSLEVQEHIVEKLLIESWTADNVTLESRIETLAEGIREQAKSTISSTLLQAAYVESLGRSLYTLVIDTQIVDIVAVKDICRKLRTAARLAMYGDLDYINSLNAVLDTLLRRLEDDNFKKRQSAYNAIREYTDSIKAQALPVAAKAAFEEKARYKVERLARTETSKAWFEGFMAHYQDNDLIFGYRWRLSPRHRIYDQCDVCANINIGYGRGVYPKDKMPTIPQHPHCVCTLKPVYWSQIRENAHLDVSKARKYINSISQSQAQALFGVEGAEKVRANGDWQKYLHGWQGLTNPNRQLTKEDFTEKA